MKAHKILCLLLALLCMISVFASCNGTFDPDETTASETSAENSADNTTVFDETTGEPAAGDLKIVENGTSQYRIILKDSMAEVYQAPALELMNAIASSTGAVLDMATDFEHPLIPESVVTDYEILIGTTRDGKYFTPPSDELKSTDYLVAVIGTRVLLLGGSASSIRKAITYFIETYVPKTPASEFTVPKGTYDLKTPDLSGTLTVMSQNLLNNNTEHGGKTHLTLGTDVDQGGKNSIKNRQPRMREHFLNIMPDVIGLQECGNWHDFLNGDSALRSAGYRLISAAKGNKLSIYYNSNTVTALESGSIYLTEDPENLACSKEWNSNGNPRLAHYVRFKHNETGDTFVVVNCHIGFENKVLQYNQTRVVAEYCAQLMETYNDPIICTGDFNSQKGSDHYEGYVNSFAGGFMADTKFEATESATGTGSFHALGSRQLDSNAIDQVMVSEGDFLVYTYRVDNTTFGDGDLYYSDHFGVIATMSIIKE